MRPATRSNAMPFLPLPTIWQLSMTACGTRRKSTTPCALSLEPAVGAVDDQAGQLDMLRRPRRPACGRRRHRRCAWRRARRTGGRVTAASGWTRHRCRAAGTAACRGRTPVCSMLRERLALVVERAGVDAEFGGVDRAAHRGSLMPSRPAAASAAGQRQDRRGESPAAAAKKRRLFSIGTVPASTGSALQEIVPTGTIDARSTVFLEYTAAKAYASPDEQSIHARRRQRRARSPISASGRSARIATW